MSQYPLTESTLSVRVRAQRAVLWQSSVSTITSWLVGLSVSSSYRSSPLKVRFTTAVSITRLSTHHAATSTLDAAFSLFSVAFDNLSIHIMTRGVFPEGQTDNTARYVWRTETSPEALLECRALLATKPLMTATKRCFDTDITICSPRLKVVLITITARLSLLRHAETKDHSNK